MIVIVEGVDGSGKTTLARQLCEKYGLSYAHEGPPPKNVSALEHYGSILDAARFTGGVFDRFALGERVYGPVLRGEDRLGPMGWRVFKRLVTAVGAFEVLCMPPYRVCYDSWSSGRPELFKDVIKFQEIYTRFYDLKDEQFIYVYEAPGAFEDLCAALELHDKLRTPLPKGVVGAQDARYLFVGEQGSNPDAKIDLPFFSDKGCSEYLTSSLDRAGFYENEIALINAYSNIDGSRYKIPTYPVTVALGSVATAACRDQKIKCKTVYHPQYWLRFHHGDPDGYAKMLRDCRDVHFKTDVR